MFGINRTEFELLCSSEAQDLIKTNIDKEPSALALKGVSVAVCNQVKYLQRCKTKLPHYYEARCIIPPLSYEQSSSELAAMVKREKGARFLDLTCGLGVDSHHFSKQFKEVIAIERDPLIADIAAENFRRLGATNIRVVNSSCEDFLATYHGEPFDLVYVDPARRDNTKRVFLLADCSPDIVGLIPAIKKVTNKLIIKLSPLFDKEEAERIFGHGTTLRAVSVAGECKELCAEIDFLSLEEGRIVTDTVSKNGEVKECIFEKSEINYFQSSDFMEIESYHYISILDVALRKMRCWTAYYKKYHSESHPYFETDVALWKENPGEVVGKIYKIEKVMEYKPKLIKELAIKSATIIIQNFDISIEELRKRLQLKNGSDTTLIFTTFKNKKYILKVL